MARWIALTRPFWRGGRLHPALGIFLLGLMVGVLAMGDARAQVPGKILGPAGEFSGFRPQRPIIFLHGQFGSALCDGSSGKPIDLKWGDLASLLSFKILQSPEFRALKGETKLNIFPCQLVTTFDILPFIALPFEPKIYGRFHTRMTRLKSALPWAYKECLYDWRESLEDIAEKTIAPCIDAFLKESVQGGGPGQVDIVAHSYGGLVARAYLAGSPRRAQKIKRLITVGTPHGGTIQAFVSGSFGWGFLPNALAGGLGVIRETAYTWPSVSQLLPYDGLKAGGLAGSACCLSDADTKRPIDLRDIENWRKFGFIPAAFRSGPAFDLLSRSVASAVRTHDRIATNPIPETVDVINIVGVGFESNISLALGADQPGSDLQIKSRNTSAGDGTVNQFSAMSGGFGRAAQPGGRPRPARIYPVVAEHASMFDNERVIAIVECVLQGTKDCSGSLSARPIPKSEEYRQRAFAQENALSNYMALNGISSLTAEGAARRERLRGSIISKSKDGAYLASRVEFLVQEAGAAGCSIAARARFVRVEGSSPQSPAAFVELSDPSVHGSATAAAAVAPDKLTAGETDARMSWSLPAPARPGSYQVALKVVVGPSKTVIATRPVMVFSVPGPCPARPIEPAPVL